MTLYEVIDQPAYWLILFGTLTLGTVALNVRPLDFRFVALLFTAQYVAHTAVATGASAMTGFAAGFFVVFVTASSVLQRRLVGRTAALVAEPRGRFDSLCALAGRVFLTGYWLLHMVVLPPTFGAINLDTRLAERHHDVVVSYLGALVLPALTACMWTWLRTGYRFRWYDAVPLAASVLGMLGSNSKVGLLPLLLAFAGVAALRRKSLRSLRVPLALAGVALVALAVRLVLYYPGHDPATAFSSIAYRIAANTDSVDYLVRAHATPQQYPFAGPAALVPFLTKRLGVPYGYGPGVWLYGILTGNYRGFGPNPGILMDYFANLGWWGLSAAVLVGAGAGFLAVRSTAAKAALLSTSYVAFVDVQLFELAVVPPLAVLGLTAALLRVPDFRAAALRLEAALEVRAAAPRTWPRPLRALAERRRAKPRAARSGPAEAEFAAVP